jgi:hypothetical protein
VNRPSLDGVARMVAMTLWHLAFDDKQSQNQRRVGEQYIDRTPQYIVEVHVLHRLPTKADYTKSLF